MTMLRTIKSQFKIRYVIIIYEIHDVENNMVFCFQVVPSFQP